MWIVGIIIFRGMWLRGYISHSLPIEKGCTGGWGLFWVIISRWFIVLQTKITDPKYFQAARGQFSTAVWFQDDIFVLSSLLPL